MKIGNVSQTVLKRSILKTIHQTREEALFTPAIEETCQAVRVTEEACAVTTTALVTGNEKSIGVYGVAKVINDLATRCAEPVGVTVEIMLPPHAYESRLKAMMEHMEAICTQQSIQILSAHAQVSVALNQALVSVTGIGTAKSAELMQSNQAKADEDIVLIGCIGLEGMLRVLGEREEELRKRFVPAFIQQMKESAKELAAQDAIRIVQRHEGVSAMHQIGGGGILAALWEVAESAGIGLEAELSKMTIKQETIEVCEFYHMNPYQLTSTGAILVFTRGGEALVRDLQGSGIRASKLGVTTSKTERVIIGGTEKRFLDRPQPDELMTWWERQLKSERED
ncbi:MAG: AIR synthase related protein [Hespellia sp.]|nr:AIR synthase related protein [Hespellia sp.]